MQPSLQQLFVAASNKTNTSDSHQASRDGSSEAKGHAQHKAAARGGQQKRGHSPGATFKENQSAAVVGSASAAAAAAAAAAAGGGAELIPDGSMPTQQQQQRQQKLAGSSGPAKSGPATKPQPNKSTQLYLDLGQRDFSASRCSVCGMLYTRGHSEDEKLHKAFHASALQGLKFTGWAQERVLLAEPAQGRLLLVLQSDPAAHLKKVQELCAFVEKAHGMAPGWLLSAPQARVFLYVSAQRRVVGLAVVEPLKQAFRVMPVPGGADEQEADSRQAAAGASQQQQQQQPSAAAAVPANQQQQPQQQRERQPLLWPGLQRSGRRLAAGRAVASAGSTLLSGPSSCTPGGTAGSSGGGVRADSCPNSLLLAAGAIQVASCTAEAAEQPVVAAVSGSQQQQQPSQEMPPPPPVLPRQQQLEKQSAGASAAVVSSSSQGAAGGGTVKPAAAGTQAGAGSGGSGGSRSLRVDKRRPVRAMLGVRMVWVLPEQRRTGLATKMLDAARCNMVPGYVVPCNQLAFIQPTGDGMALAAAFTGTQQFLVYGMD